MVWVDNTRILSMFAVVLIHVSAPIVIDENNFNSLQWWAGNIFDASARWCVPVFVMISGGLLLSDNKEESMRVFYKKRVKRILIPMLFWTFLFLGWNIVGRISANNSPTLLTVCKILLSGKPYFHLWFLYMLTGLYFVAPFIRVLIRNISEEEMFLFVVGLLFLAVCNNLFGTLYNTKDLLFLNWFLPYLPYFILGYIIQTSKLSPKTSVALVIFLFSAGLTALGCFFFSTFFGLEKGLYFYKYLSITVIPMSISIMFLLKKIQTPIVMDKQVNGHIAGLVLGIYLVHPLVMEGLKHYHIYAPNFNSFISIPIISALVFTISVVVVWLIGRVPYFRQVV